MQITEQTLVSDIAMRLPASVRVFHRVGIDVSGGGGQPLGEACERRRLSFPELAREIEASAAAWPPDACDWNQQPLSALVDHLVTCYHARLREEMPRVETLAARALRVHGGKAPRLLARLEAIVLELSAALSDHMRKEELVLFPAVRRLEAGQPVSHPVPISTPIGIMEEEHESAGDLFAELRTLTNGYVPPEWACETTRALYEGLAALERDMHVHVHLENNLLFPRTLRLAGVPAAHQERAERIHRGGAKPLRETAG